MNAKRLRRYLLIVGAAIALLVAFGLASDSGLPANTSGVLSLQAPSFFGVARAETAEATSVIENEAGISAWFQASSSITLSSVRGVFRTIEVETGDYIIGSVPVLNYPETEDVHVYVHKDGWILAYYLAAEPVAKIYDWRMYHDTGRVNITTKLEATIAVVANAAGMPFSASNVTYYDFRYPNATHLMLVVEWVHGGSDSFQIKLPGAFAYYERSWSLTIDRHSTSYYFPVYYRLNGVQIASVHATWPVLYGTFAAAQLPPDQYHDINVQASAYYGYGGLALLYRVP